MFPFTNNKIKETFHTRLKALKSNFPAKGEEFSTTKVKKLQQSRLEDTCEID